MLSRHLLSCTLSRIIRQVDRYRRLCVKSARSFSTAKGNFGGHLSPKLACKSEYFKIERPINCTLGLQRMKSFCNQLALLKTFSRHPTLSPSLSLSLARIDAAFLDFFIYENAANVTSNNFHLRPPVFLRASESAECAASNVNHAGSV